MNHVTEKKLNNKGFSLVELIIVIAIMAVLIGVLAPQYLKYVEKSRESADLDNYQAFISAIEVYAADPNHTLTSGEVITFTKNSGATSSVSGASNNAAAALTDSGMTLGNIVMRSDKYTKPSTGTGSATITINITNGVVSFSFNNTDLQKALGR